MPPYDAVVAITASTGDIGNELDLIWKYLLPALKDSPLPADQASDRRLTARLASLSLPTPQGDSTPVAAALGRTFTFASNPQELDALTVQPAADGSGYSITLRLQGRDQTFPCGNRAWAKGAEELRPDTLGFGGHSVVATAGAWSSPSDFTFEVCHYRTPLATTYRVHFVGDACEVFFQDNLSLSGPPPTVHLTGHVQS